MSSSPPQGGAHWWRQALVWLIGLGLMGWLLRQVPLETVRSALSRPSPTVWALTLAGLGLSYLLRAARLQAVMGLEHAGGQRWLGLRLDALRVILMHNAAVNLLPMRAGELSFPYLASRLLRMPLSRAVASLLWMRLQDLAVLMALGLACWPQLPLAWRAGGLALILLGWHAGLHLLTWLGRRANPAAPSKWQDLLARVQQALLEPHHHHWSTWAFTWANWAVKLTAGAWLIAAICQSPLGGAWAGALGGELAAIVPLQGPAGFGTYEAGVWAGLALGTSPASPLMAMAVPAALALHLCFLLCAVLAGALAWLTGPLLSSSSGSAPGIPD